MDTKSRQIVAGSVRWDATGTGMSRLSLVALALCIGCGPTDSPSAASSTRDPIAEPEERAEEEDAERESELVDEAMAGLPDDLSAEDRARMEEWVRGAAPDMVEREADADERAAIARTQGCVDAVMSRHYGEVDPRDTERAIAEQVVEAGVRRALMAGDDPCSCDAPGSAACAALVDRVASR